MAVYAIGDIQGCHAALTALLEAIDFDPRCDQLWFTGDLVNRGPESLAVLRFVHGLGDSAVTVLGNHDLHLLAVAAGHTRPRPADTLDDILSAPDRDQLIDWLRRRPLLHHAPGLGYTLVHAGLAPQWDLETALACAEEVGDRLRGPGVGELLAHMYGDEPDLWRDELQGWARVRCIINAFTRLRYCDARGRLRLEYKGPLAERPTGLVPWFDAPGRGSRDMRIVFGHWSALGFYRDRGVVCLDSGCLWGGRLTALRLDVAEPVVTSVACEQTLRPTRQWKAAGARFDL